MIPTTPEPAPTTAVDPRPAEPELPLIPTTESESSPAPSITNTTNPVETATDSVSSESATVDVSPTLAPEPTPTVTTPAAEVALQPIPPSNPVPMTEAQMKPLPALVEDALPPTPTEKQPIDTPTEPIVDEPENELTKKFTDEEWKALKEFRSQLPDIFAEAYPEEPKAREIPVTMWGVTLDPVNPMKDARMSVVLMKFLRARNLSVREGREMLVNTLRWREQFNIKAAMEEDFPAEVFGHLGHVFGRDKGGRPVVYNVYGGNTKAAFDDVQRFIRWRVALMEKSVALLDFNEIDQQVQIHDYAGVSITSRDANSKAAASEATNIFQSHYPELLYKKFFINVPTFLTWIFWAFKSLISAKTLAKMTIVGSGKSTIRKALVPYIDENELPERYGGAVFNAF